VAMAEDRAAVSPRDKFRALPHRIEQMLSGFQPLFGFSSVFGGPNCEIALNLKGFRPG
jgi:hypothetical protein